MNRKAQMVAAFSIVLMLIFEVGLAAFLIFAWKWRYKIGWSTGGYIFTGLVMVVFAFIPIQVLRYVRQLYITSNNLTIPEYLSAKPSKYNLIYSTSFLLFGFLLSGALLALAIWTINSDAWTIYDSLIIIFVSAAWILIPLQIFRYFRDRHQKRSADLPH